MTNMRREQRTTEYDHATLEADAVIRHPDGTVEYHGLRTSMRGRSHVIEETGSMSQPAALSTPNAEPVPSTWRSQMAADIAAVKERRGLIHQEYPALPPGA